MGILDDAIRQHLELKRRLGADDDELKQLEDEAFGPPTRPGEPDFPESETDGDGAADEPETELDLAEPANEPVPELSAEEPPAAEHPVIETADEGATEEAGAIFDQPLEDELDLSDLDLDLEDEEEDELSPPAEAAPPIETLETEEHTLEDFEDEDDLEEESEAAGPATADHEVEEGDETEEPQREGDEEDEDEDVLADTPEFLRDAPEDDELWFEQGAPKDFDFDE
jgi:hypothetical protein